VFKRALSWAIYTKSKSLVDRRLAEFNTTGLDLRAVRRKGKLVGGLSPVKIVDKVFADFLCCHHNL
jgi:hypothetical protein